jgi:hypothetical protein
VARLRFDTFKYLIVPFSFVAFYGSILLYLLIVPLVMLYKTALCMVCWYALPKRGKNVLIAYTEKQKSSPWLAAITPLVEGKTMDFNYDEPASWRFWSMPARLFRNFGPRTIPPQFTSRTLPAVIVFRKFKWPRKFSFGVFSKNPEETLVALRAILEERQAF